MYLQLKEMAARPPSLSAPTVKIKSDEAHAADRRGMWSHSFGDRIAESFYAESALSPREAVAGFNLEWSCRSKEMHIEDIEGGSSTLHKPFPSESQGRRDYDLASSYGLLAITCEQFNGTEIPIDPLSFPVRIYLTHTTLVFEDALRAKELLAFTRRREELFGSVWHFGQTRGVSKTCEQKKQGYMFGDDYHLYETLLENPNMQSTRIFVKILISVVVGIVLRRPGILGYDAHELTAMARNMARQVEKKARSLESQLA